MSGKKISTTEALTPSQVRFYISEILESNQQIQALGKVPTAINIEGHAGIGKTSLVEQIAVASGLHFVKINLAQTDELGDLVGMPVKQYKRKSGAWITEPEINSMSVDALEADPLTGDLKQSYAIPGMLQDKMDGKGGVLVLDDFTRAASQFQQACMEICARQEYMSWKLPKGWTVVLTTNPADGHYMVNEQDSAMTSRYVTLRMKFDLNSWVDWALDEGIDNRCINFIVANKGLFDDETKATNPRAMVTFFNMISKYPNFEKNLDHIRILGSGVGTDIVNQFIAFINQKLDQIPDLATLIAEAYDDVKAGKDPEDAATSVTRKMKKFTFKETPSGEYELDSIRSPILATRTSKAFMRFYEEQPIDAFSKRLIENIIDEQIFLPDGLRLLLMGIRSNNKFNAIQSLPTVVKALAAAKIK